MRHALRTQIYWLFLIAAVGNARGQTTFPTAHVLIGTVLDPRDDSPLPGASVMVDRTAIGAVTDENGRFKLELEEGTHVLRISFIGYELLELKSKVPMDEELKVYLEPSPLSLKAVEVVSSGYVDLPRERVTGSFVKVENRLLNRRVGPNLIDRLEDVTSGLIFNRGPSSGRDPMSIRGRATIFANTSPLVVVDNFTYDGPLENINPNDVESVTVLRDAAAASIWGARAGNGVIVITTRSGQKASSPQVRLNTNVLVTEKPDMFYTPQMTIDDYIDVETMLFGRGYYSSSENSPAKTALSPVVETLIAQRDGKITENEAQQIIQGFRAQDLRDELSAHYYQPDVNRQYALSVTGGGDTHRYAFSAGYDDRVYSVKGNNGDRFTLSARNHWRWKDGRFSATADVYMARTRQSTGTEIPTAYPYEALIGASGEPRRIVRQYSSRYLSSVEGEGLLDWYFVPLNEVGMLDDRDFSLDVRANTSLSYKFTETLRVEGSHQYWTNTADRETRRPAESFYVRDMVNQYTQRREDGSFYRPIPDGELMDAWHSEAQSHNFRIQAIFGKDWGPHRLDALAGWETKDLRSASRSARYYGYRKDLGISTPVDFVTRFHKFHNPSEQVPIPSNQAHRWTTDRFLSYYMNLAYQFRGRYAVTASTRKDQSNLFGVEANRKGVPLWSAGLGWTVSEEPFYRLQWLQYLKLRGTFGYSGNTDKSVSALTTASYLLADLTHVIPGIPIGVVTRPPNPNLSWETSGMLNLGLDFESVRGRLSGNVELFYKKSSDLIGDMTMPSSRGVSSFRGNFASASSRGLDAMLTSLNLAGAFRWRTDFLYSHISEKVTEYSQQSTVLNYLTSSSTHLERPLVGYPLYSIYSVAWGGLSPEDGSPRGLLEGEPSINYNAIINSYTPETLHYHGPARPSHFGSIRNTFDWRGWNLSFNISYRLGYFYRRRSVDYGEVLRSRGGHPDYALRWQKEGDELHTHVPAVPANVNANRDRVYLYSDVLVERGDHFRFQDIRIGHLLDRGRFPSIPFRRIEIYGYANNIGVLWKHTKDPLDPDFQTNRPLTSLAVGINVEF